MNLYVALEAAWPRGGIAIEQADSDLAYTWDDLRQGSALLATLFTDLGLRPGERVMLQTEKSVEALMVWLACLRAGLVLVPLNPAYQQAELDHFLKDAEPRLLVCAPEAFHWASKRAFLNGVEWVFTLGAERRGTLLDRAAQLMPRCRDEVLPRAPDDAAAILYTSGTTGISKGALLTHGNLLSNAQTLVALWGFTPDDVLVHALPIFHVHGLFVASHCALMSGSRLRWCPRFEPALVTQQLRGATVFMGVPTLYTRLLGFAGFTREATASIRLFVSGSAPLQAETFDAFTARTGQVILERYGMSETGMLTSNPLKGERRRASVGPALPGVQLRIAPSETGDADGVGAVEVKGPNVFGGYWKRPELKTTEFTPDGFFRTGDLGRLDPDGYLHLVGRAKDLVITGGFNVYPAEVEGYLNALPGVQESAVIGLPHPDFGEAVTALLVPQPGATLDPDALLSTLRGQIAAFKCPKRLLVVADLPRNAMGKVQKKALREQHAGLYA